ncbi:MAG: hypothetical protein WDZ35_02495 [Crocinitomicaceae bacterium]
MMKEVLLYTGVYGVLALAVINLFLVFLTYQKSYFSFFDMIWISLGIGCVSLLAFTVFFRHIANLHWMYSVGILICFFGMIGLFLNLTQRLMRNRQ